MSQKTDMNEQLLKAFKKSGMTRNKLSETSGVRYASIHGWVAGNRKLMLDSANKIADVLGLQLRRKKGR